MRPDSIGEFVISGHARLEMQRRDVTDDRRPAEVDKYWRDQP